jgi:hypothetical protein
LQLQNKEINVSTNLENSKDFACAVLIFQNNSYFWEREFKLFHVTISPDSLSGKTFISLGKQDGFDG